jgi:ankyrin repeat protein
VTRVSRPTRALPEHPDLDQLRRQAKELLVGFLAGHPDATAEVHVHFRNATATAFALHDAQLVIARAYGFASWPSLKAHVDGLTAKHLIEAARTNDPATVAAILKVRPDLINMQSAYADERRALHYAVINRTPDMVQLLMRHGANARLGVHPHRDATTPWTLARERGFQEIVAIIEHEEQTRPVTAAPSAAASTPDTDVRSAVVRGDTEWLRDRHARRSIVNHVNWDNGGLLTLAAANDQTEVLKLLLDFGFDPDEAVRWNEGPDAAYSQGYPLWHCAAAGKLAMAELLLQHGADPNVHVDSSGSAVYAAYSHHQWAMVDLLKRYSGLVTPDIVGVYRETALARDLLSGAANSEDSVPPGRTLPDYLLEFALSGGAVDIVRMALEEIDWPRTDPRWFRMLERGLDFWNHIRWLDAGRHDFDRNSYVASFRLLVQRSDPNLIGGLGRTALHEVAAAGAHVTDAEVSTLATVLLEAGARVDGRDELLRSTPLGWACRWGRADLARVLLEHGADPLERGGEAWSRPRAWAETMHRQAVLTVLAGYGG